jgi:glycosyltransferase involved in cell wall biosynthesis
LLHYLLRRPLTLIGLFLTLPFDNREDRPAKALKTVAHLLHAVRFAWLLRGRRDPVHAHFAYKAALAALVASRLNGGPFSFTAHGSATVHAPSRYALDAKARGAEFIVAVSDFNKRTLLEYCPGLDPERIVVNRTGVFLEEFPLREDRPRRPGPFRLVNVASLYPIKNHEGLVDVCAELARRGVDFRLEILGKDDAGRRALLEDRARRAGVLDRLVFRGMVDHGAIAAALADADLFVLTSHSEGIPVAVMEAMARGVPVVAPRVTGLPELIVEGESGWLADPARPEEFADRIAGALGDPDGLAAAARAARAVIESDYDMRKNARRLAEVFDERLPG